MEKHEPITWRAREYEHRERSDNWYVALGILSIGGAVAAFILGDALFGLLILIAAFAMALFAAKPAAQHSFVITKRGIAIGAKLYPWNSLESFWIAENGMPPRLLIKSSRFFMPLLVIPLMHDMDPDTVHERLSAYLQEEELAEPFADRLLERLGW